MNLERVVVEVFGGCNYACVMCPQTTGRESQFVRKMPLSLFTSILDQLPGHPVINLEGSGEPTLAKDLHRYVRACTDRSMPAYMYCNGSGMGGAYMRGVIDAGLQYIRFSILGHDRESYRAQMGVDGFDRVMANIRETIEYIRTSNSTCRVGTYHLVSTRSTEADYRALIQPLGVLGYIWEPHNWSGNQGSSVRRPTERRTCGRPFANELTIRAGGVDGKLGAVTPCCQTMGPPNESRSVLGHMSDQTLHQIWNGEAYETLRDAHREQRFDDVDYCSNCDFLYDTPESLVWTNDSEFHINSMIGTRIELRP